jgi:cytidine deaminase
MDQKRLLASARDAARHAYAPYSGFRVGAAVAVEVAGETKIITGANIENGSFGLTLCAERAALAATRMLVSPDTHDDPHITQIAIACLDTDPDAPAHQRMPCGACRQWIAELAPYAVVYVDGVEREFRLPDLLPEAFMLDRRVP